MLKSLVHLNIIRVGILEVISPPQPLRAEQKLFHPWRPDRRVGRWSGGVKKLVKAVSQKP